MAEGELFVEGQPPDFSVLPELLCPPCLESEPCSSAASNSLLPHPRGGVGPETAATRESRFEPFVGIACCLQIPETKALDFLQETAQLLSQPEPSGRGSNAGRPLPRQAGLPGRPWRSSQGATTSRVDCCFLPDAALASFGSLDALSLISLHCSSLEAEPVVRIDSAAGGAPAQQRVPIPPARDHGGGGNRLWTACVEEPRTAQLPGIGVPRKSEPPRGGTRRVSRKQPSPRRSCEPLDPAFQGVTLQMQLCLRPGSSEGCKLLICPRYSSGKLRKRRVPLAKEEGRAGSSEEEEGCLSTHRNKRCASCKTRKTPLWRDAEDGTPLCNACGIRYKKYRIRCFQCWNIPKHGGKPYSHCSNCGGRLRVVAAQPKSGKRCATF